MSSLLCRGPRHGGHERRASNDHQTNKVHVYSQGLGEAQILVGYRWLGQFHKDPGFTPPAGTICPGSSLRSTSLPRTSLRVRCSGAIVKIISRHDTKVLGPPPRRSWRKFAIIFGKYSRRLYALRECVPMSFSLSFLSRRFPFPPNLCHTKPIRAPCGCSSISGPRTCSRAFSGFLQLQCHAPWQRRAPLHLSRTGPYHHSLDHRAHFGS